MLCSSNKSLLGLTMLQDGFEGHLMQLAGPERECHS